MRNALLFAILAVFSQNALISATYYVQDGGGGSKAQSVDIGTPMSVATFNANTYAAGDTVYFMGVFNLAGTAITIPSSGSGWAAGEFITYVSYSGSPAILDGGGKDTKYENLMVASSKSYLVLDGFTFTNITSTSVAGGQALSTEGSIIRCQALLFTGYITGGTGGAWVEVGGNGSQTFSNCYFNRVDDEAISNHSPGTYDLSLTNCTFTFAENFGTGSAMQLVYAPTALTFSGCTFIGTADVPVSLSLASGISPLFHGCRFYETFLNGMAGGPVFNYCVITRSSASIFNGATTCNNCVFYGTTVAFQHYSTTERTVIAGFTNCIFYSMTYVVTWNGGGLGGQCNLDHCIRYDTGGRNPAGTLDGYSENVVSTSDPLFVSPTTDFQLQSGSPAVNAGRAIAGLDRDFGGNAVPWFTSPDIGAFEWFPQNRGAANLLHVVRIIKP